MVHKKINRLFAASVLISAACFSFYGCGSGTTSENSDMNDSVKVDTAAQNKSIKNVFYSIPSPVELGQIIERSGATYDASLLNDINNSSKYTTAITQALNLGVYGADLSITNIFDKTQESLFYMKCTSALAKNLGISTAFNGETMNRMDANKGNHDSLMSIITDSYYETDDYLKENQRGHLSALVIAGGWVEALYIGTKLAVKTNNDEMRTRIAELKGSLTNLCGLLELYQGQPGIDPVLKQLTELRTIYDGVKPADSNVQVNTDEKNKVTTLGGTGKMTLTQEQFESISKKAEEIRTNIVKP